MQKYNYTRLLERLERFLTGGSRAFLLRKDYNSVMPPPGAQATLTSQIVIKLIIAQKIGMLDELISEIILQC